MGDFETTVYKGQTFTEVWASACVELYTEDVLIFHSIEEQFNYFLSLKCNAICYYHNLKFDGCFWLYYLWLVKKYELAADVKSDFEISWKPIKYMENKSFSFSLSARGQFYRITVKAGGHTIEFRDSLKLIPFSVKQIGESFGTKHKKSAIEYTGYRYAGCKITEEEKKYIANDVLVVKEALEIMFAEGHKKLTIGACCLNEYKNILNHSLKTQLEYDEMFPQLYDINIDGWKEQTAGEWIRKSYRGGWCYLVKGKENKLQGRGLTADVNSLYPSVMHSDSGSIYPIGKPCFWSGNFIPDSALKEMRYFFVRIKTRFYIKKDKLPFIQIKANPLYKSTEMLETSDVYFAKEDTYYTHWKDKEGNLHDTRVELTLTMTDYYLILEHYELVDFEILGGCWFYAEKGIFDEYIDKYRKIKMESRGVKRQIAKLFLNNLYGKMASNDDSSFKYPYVKDDGSINFYIVPEYNKKPGYIAVGSAITSYARNFTIRAAQKNFYGVDKPGFIYADTDSIHCDLTVSDLKDVPIHDTEFCHWKIESIWDYAIFVRQKTYIEHVIVSDGKEVEPYNNITCAGMPDKCKRLLDLSFKGNASPEGYIENNEWKEWEDGEKEFLFDKDGKPIKREYSDFKRGINVPGKLMPKRIPGGIVLENTTYEIR